jgi:cell wall-associated NlpC family hydrolase
MTIVRRAAAYAALSTALAMLAMAAIAMMPGAQAWAANGQGGVSARSYEPEIPVETETETGTEPTAEPSKAMLVNGRAIAPLDAPPAVRKVIAAANKIRSKPYIYGGGHGRWWDSGYDCSGAVSFALHGAKLLSSPLPSGSMQTWGAPGPGKWITVYANAGHAYAVIAGLRFDTAGNSSIEGTGPRWHESLAAAAGGRFMARHPVGY